MIMQMTDLFFYPQVKNKLEDPSGNMCFFLEIDTVGNSKIQLNLSSTFAFLYFSSLCDNVLAGISKSDISTIRLTPYSKTYIKKLFLGTAI